MAKTRNDKDKPLSGSQLQCRNLLGMLGALHPYEGEPPPIPELIDEIERRFAIASPVHGKVPTRRAMTDLRQQLAEALQHLRPDTVDWFKQRCEYLLYMAEHQLSYDQTS